MDDVVGRAKALERRIDERNPVILELLDHAKRNRRVSRMAFALGVVLAIVVAVLGYTVVQVQGNTENVARVRDVAIAVAAALKETCEDNNADKAKEAEFWQMLFAIPRTAPRTPEQQAQVDSIQAEVIATYAPDDCDVEAP